MLIPLMKTLKKRYNNKVNHHFTDDNVLLFDFLEKNINPELIVLNINDVCINTVGLINAVNEIAPLSVKLIIAETKKLLWLQSQIAKKESVLFLTDTWGEDEFELMLNSAENQTKLLRNNLFEENAALLFKKVEDEVASRFDKLIDSNLAKDKILSIISHDLKSPFLGLLGLTDILLSEWNNLEDTQKIELISDARKTSEETLKLLEDLLDWGKSQKEKLEISINEIKVRNLVNTSIKVNEDCAIPKGIKVLNKISNSLKVNADEHMIATVFRNLISNAVKFTRPGGNVLITAKENKDHFTFCVSDDGTGVDKPHIIDMFNNGNRKQQTNKNKTDHRGLGLLLCKDFVERSGGKIWLETQKGVGSKFFFTLPCQV